MSSPVASSPEIHQEEGEGDVDIPRAAAPAEEEQSVEEASSSPASAEDADEAPATWWNVDFIDQVLANAEQVVSEAVSSTASTIRENVGDSLAHTAAVLGSTEFYRNNIAYVPEDAEEARQLQAQQEQQSLLKASEGSEAKKKPMSATSSGKKRKSLGAVVIPSNSSNEPLEMPQATLAKESTLASASPPPRSEEQPSNSTNFYEDSDEDDGGTEEDDDEDDDVAASNLLLDPTKAPIEERLQVAGPSIGVLKVMLFETKRFSVDGSFDPTHTHAYCKVSLGPDQSWTSPIARPVPSTLSSEGSFLFSPPPSESMTLEFVAQDVMADLCVELYQQNIVVQDTLIGKVLVPLSSVIPTVRKALAGTHPRCAPYTLESWFEVFALTEKKKFTPANHDIAGTGLPRPILPIGFIKMRLELHLHGRISMWAGYAMPPLAPFAVLQPRPLPTGDFKAIAAVGEAGRGFKRNFQRVRVAFTRLISIRKPSWAPLAALTRARSSPVQSVFVIGFAFYICLLSPMWALPMNSFLVLFLCVWISHQKAEPKSYLVWEEHVHDPDDDLGPIQKIVKLVYLLEKFARWAGIVADNLERAVNLLNFSDERVTIAALLVWFAICAISSLVLYLVSPGYVAFAGFLMWYLRGMGETARAAVRRIASKKRERQESIDHVGLRSEGIFSQTLAVLKMIGNVPSLTGNIFARVPTEDELGHRWISNTQRVSEARVEEETRRGSRLADEERTALEGASLVEEFRQAIGASGKSLTALMDEKARQLEMSLRDL